MRTGFRAAAIAAILSQVLLISTAQAERKVYKCANADGTVVFASQPCGENAAEVHVDAGQSTLGSPGSSSAALRDIGDSVEDSSCRHDAEALRVTDGTSALDELVRRRDALRQELAYANNNLAGATWEAGVRKEIGDLETAIGQERMRLSQMSTQSDQAYRSAIAECDRKRDALAQRRREEDAAARDAASTAAAPKAKDGGSK